MGKGNWQRGLGRDLRRSRTGTGSPNSNGHTEGSSRCPFPLLPAPLLFNQPSGPFKTLQCPRSQESSLTQSPRRRTLQCESPRVWTSLESTETPRTETGVSCRRPPSVRRGGASLTTINCTGVRPLNFHVERGGGGVVWDWGKGRKKKNDQEYRNTTPYLREIFTIVGRGGWSYFNVKPRPVPHNRQQTK